MKNKYKRNHIKKIVSKFVCHPVDCFTEMWLLPAIERNDNPLYIKEVVNELIIKKIEVEISLNLWCHGIHIENIGETNEK